MFIISSGFIGNFKIGDNINYNLDILALLYAQYAAASEHDRQLLRKPIVVIAVSIVEAMLYDFHARVKTFAREGVLSLTAAVSAYIRGKKLDVLEHYIASAR